jgi:hypothetical protein
LNLLRLFYKKHHSKGVNKVFDLKHWSFLEKESTGTSTQEISESEERSSIEFERYFKKILVELEKQEYKKVLIVIDNLDRVDPEDSLKIWSTLQTFFQHRNPSSQSSSDSQLKLWLIVPYDRQGLAKLWDKESLLNAQENDHKSVSKSFFDKCFQLIIPVPPLTHNAWEDFLKNKLDKSFSSEKIVTTESQKSFKADVINVFKNTRKSATDIPSYREIINFVNQVNWLKASVNEDISNKAIAYFAIDKYISFKSRDEIIKSLISDESETFNLEHKKHVAGIIYGVSPEKGMEILLDKEVAKYWGESVNDNFKKDDLISLEASFREAFWTQLMTFLKFKNSPNHSIQDLLKLSFFIESGQLEERSSSLQQWLLEEMDRWVQKSRVYPSLTDVTVNMYKSLFRMSRQRDNLLEHFYKVLASPVKCELLAAGTENSEHLIELFDELNSISRSSKRDFSLKPQELILDRDPSSDKHSAPIVISWIHFAKEVFNSKTEIYKYLYPPSSLVWQLSEHGYDDTFVEKYLSNLHHLLRYFFECKSFYPKLDWERLLTVLTSYVINNDLRDNDNYAESFYLALIELFKSGHDLRNLLASANFQNYIAPNPEFIKYPALLYLAFNVSGDAPVTSSIPCLRDFWREENDGNNDLNSIFDHLEFIDNFEALWNLFKDLDSIRAIELIKRVIKNFDTEKHSKIFSDKPFDKLNKLIIFSKDFMDKEDFGRFFINNTNIQKDLLDQSVDITKYDESLYYLVKTYSSEEKPKILENLKNKVEALLTDQWKSALDESCNKPKLIYLTSLALEIQKKDPQFTLKGNYHDALLDFAKDLLINRQKSLSDWQMDNIESLKNLIDKSFQESFEERVIEYIVESLLAVSKNSLESCKILVNFSKLALEKRFENYVEEILKNTPSVEDLEKIFYVYDNSEKIVPSEDFKNRIKDRIENLPPTQESQIQTLLNQISEKIGNQTP